MLTILDLDAERLRRFTLPHVVRLLGEHQHLLGAGCIALATGLRVQFEVEETSGGFELSFMGTPGEEWADEAKEESTSSFRCAEGPTGVTWQAALGAAAAEKPSALEGLSICVDLGELWDIAPREVLIGSPTVSVGLTLAALAHRGRGGRIDSADLASTACAARAVFLGGHPDRAQRFRPEALLSISGGACFVEPEGELLNVQELVPPDSLILAADCATGSEGGPESNEEAVLHAVEVAQSHIGTLSDQDEALSALFALSGSELTERETSMLYALLRVRQMTESLIERLADPVVDNDVLAEACDEESAILSDYFGFPQRRLAPVRTAATEAGALGAKLTWAFGGLPASVIIAPGRREEVLRTLRRKFSDVGFLSLELDTDGLLQHEEIDRND